MPCIERLLAVVLVVSLGACRQSQPDPAGGIAPPSHSAMEFRGSRPCVDCDGIRSWLRLEQEGGRGRYRMIEAYRAGGNDRSFEEQGEWRSEGDLLWLRNASGGERVYARRDDGSLQARDSRGRRLPAAEDDVMVPVAFDDGR